MDRLTTLWGRIGRPVRQPSQWLLGRAHRPWYGLLPFALMGLAAYTGEYRPHWGWSAAFLYGAVSTGMDAAGGLAHRWWEDGRIWQDTVCPCCDHPHGGGGGWGGFPGFPDGPEDHGRTAPRPVGAPVQG